MGFKKSNLEKKLSAAQKELSLYRGLLMDNQEVTFKQARLLEVILSHSIGKDCAIPGDLPEITEEWLENLRNANLEALSGMMDIYNYNEDRIMEEEE